MPRIFISYRREESAGHAGQVYDHLRERDDRGADHLPMPHKPFNVLQLSVMILRRPKGTVSPPFGEFCPVA